MNRVRRTSPEDHFRRPVTLDKPRDSTMAPNARLVFLIAFSAALMATSRAQASKFDWWNKLSGGNNADASSESQAWRPVLAPEQPAKDFATAVLADATDNSKAFAKRTSRTWDAPSINSGGRQTFRSYEFKEEFDRPQRENENAEVVTKISPLKRNYAVSKVEALLDSYAAKLSSRANVLSSNYPETQSERNSGKASSKVSWDDHLEFPSKQTQLPSAPLIAARDVPPPTTTSSWLETATQPISAAIRDNRYQFDERPPKITSRFGTLTAKQTQDSESFEARPARQSERTYDDFARDVEGTTEPGFEHEFEEDERAPISESRDDSYEQPAPLQRKTNYNGKTSRLQTARPRYTDRLTIQHDVPAKQTEREAPRGKSNAQRQTTTKRPANAKVSSYFTWQKRDENEKLKSTTYDDSAQLRTQSYEDADLGELRGKSYDDSANLRKTSDDNGKLRKNYESESGDVRGKTSSSYDDRVGQIRSTTRKPNYGQRQTAKAQQQKKTTTSYSSDSASRLRTSSYEETTTSRPRFEESERLRAKYDEETADLRISKPNPYDSSARQSDASSYEKSDANSGIERESPEDSWEDDKAPLRQEKDTTSSKLVDNYEKQAARINAKGGTQAKSQNQRQSNGYSWSATIDHGNQKSDKVVQQTSSFDDDDERSAKLTTSSYDDNSRLQKKTGWTAQKLIQTTTEAYSAALRDDQDDFGADSREDSYANSGWSDNAPLKRDNYNDKQPLKRTGDSYSASAPLKRDNYESAPQKRDNYNDNLPLKRQGDSYSSARETEVLGNLQQKYETKSQNLEEEEVEGHGDGTSCRLEDSIPGTPETDYPTLSQIPDTQFSCADHDLPGYYGDVDAQCQVFHVCQADGRKDDFLCPIGTIFNQQLFVCDWWMNFRCQDTPSFYELNADLYVTPVAQNNNQLNRRSGAIKGGSGNYAARAVEEEDDAPSGEIEEENNSYSNLRDSSNSNLQQKSEPQKALNKVYFDSQIASTKSPQKQLPQTTSYGKTSSSRAPRIQQQSNAYGARVRKQQQQRVEQQQQTSQLRDYDNWAAASKEVSKEAKAEPLAAAATEPVKVTTPALTLVTSPVPTPAPKTTTQSPKA